MVEPVERDSRGLVDPAAGLARFALRRHAPSRPVARFVDRYWVVDWDLPPGAVHDQEVLVHPVVNVVFGDGPARVTGPRRERWVRHLAGRGEVLGVMFRPGGFSPFSDRHLDALTDEEVPFTAVFGEEGADLERAVAAAPDEDARVAAVDGFWAARVPAHRLQSENVTELIERVVADPTVQRVSVLAELAGCTPRQLQRLFADHVGIGPKWVVQRYRLYDAAERAVREPDLDWARVAAELGYADQAHLTRDFAAAIGMPPARYAERCRATAAEAASGSGTDGTGPSPPPAVPATG